MAFDMGVVCAVVVFGIHFPLVRIRLFKSLAFFFDDGVQFGMRLTLQSFFDLLSYLRVGQNWRRWLSRWRHRGWRIGGIGIDWRRRRLGTFHEYFIRRRDGVDLSRLPTALLIQAHPLAAQGGLL